MEKKRNILLVDDDDLYAEALTERLERRHFNPFSLTKNIKESLLRVIEENQIEIVLLDLIMPSADGKEILKIIREKYERSALPVIMVTGIDDSADVAESFKLGANDYITKPISFDISIARIDAHLSQCDLDRELIMKKELEVLNAMIITYCHEINNPLTIVMNQIMEYRSDIGQGENLDLSKSQNALRRIHEIMKKIGNAGEQPRVIFEAYSSSSKMVKIR